MEEDKFHNTENYAGAAPEAGSWSKEEDDPVAAALAQMPNSKQLARILEPVDIDVTRREIVSKARDAFFDTDKATDIQDLIEQGCIPIGDEVWLRSSQESRVIRLTKNQEFLDRQKRYKETRYLPLKIVGAAATLGMILTIFLVTLNDVDGWYILLVAYTIVAAAVLIFTSLVVCDDSQRPGSEWEWRGTDMSENIDNPSIPNDVLELATTVQRRIKVPSDLKLYYLFLRQYGPSFKNGDCVDRHNLGGFLLARCENSCAYRRSNPWRSAVLAQW